MENEKSTEYFYFLKFISIIAVILLHVIITPVSYYFESYSAIQLHILRIVMGYLYWCVPVFVMITGALFLNEKKELPLSKLFKKYLRRFFVDILIFGTLYSFLEIFFSNKNMKISYVFLNSLKSVLTGNSWNFMWYIYMIFFLYMLLPILKVFINAVSEKLLRYCLLLLFIFSSVYPYLQTFINLNLRIPDISIYIFYLLLGYSVHFDKVKVDIRLALGFLFIYMGYTIMISFFDFFYVERSPLLKTLNFDSPFIVLGSVSIFYLTRNIIKIPKFVNFIAQISFGLYLTHQVPINFCYKFLNLTPSNYSLISSLLVTFFVTLISSITVVFFTRKFFIVREYIF